MDGLEQLIDMIATASENSGFVEDGDYRGEDGMIYCHRCHTPKQSRMQFFFGERTVMHMCKCQKEERDRKEALLKKQELEQKISDNRRIGFPEPAMTHWTFENDDMSNERLTTAMRNYVENFDRFRRDGKGLLLYGKVGTGKTFAACEVANALVDEGYPVLVTNFARITNTLQGTFDKQEYLDSLNRFQLLVIDDLSAERDTGFMNEQIFQVIDGRYRAKLPMIVTTNLTAEELKSPADISKQRIYNRVLEMCHPIKVEGANKRNKNIIAGFDEMQSILGLNVSE